jgi:hypothetical protein
MFLPRDESSAWAWLPLGIRNRFDAAEAAAGMDSDLHFAFGDAARGVAGFRLTHQQALAAQAVALAAGSPPRVVTFGEVAPVAMMLGSAELLRACSLASSPVLYFERSGQASTPNRAQRDRLGCGAQALRRRFARQYKIGGLLLAAAVRSRLSAFFITVLATPDLAFTGYLIGHVMGFDAFG